MLLSMTGHGEARRSSDAGDIVVEIRTVNNRYLKVTYRLSEGCGALEPQLESLLRQHLRRGSVQVTVQVAREASPDDYRVNETVLNGYLRQLQAVQQRTGLQEPIRLETLLPLPGVVTELGSQRGEADADWAAIEQTVLAALDNLARMRAQEGAAMAADLHANCQAIARDLDKIQQRAPRVIENYRDRLLERLNKLLQQYDVSLDAGDVVREVAILVDRSDISEELARLGSHLEQFGTITSEPESNGRKLEFLIQEMFREANTIGSKANDAEISRQVIDIKAAIERMREMIQNVE